MNKQTKDQGLSILGVIGVQALARYYLAWLLSREFGVTKRQAWRWTTIAGWAVYISGRNFAGGMDAHRNHSTTMKEWSDNIKAIAEEHAQTNDG